MRQQPPLWRSQTASQEQKENIALKNIADHKNDISRHRQEHEPPKTPPGYWTIGFPDTQEAEHINKQAEEVHQYKQKVAATGSGSVPHHIYKCSVLE